MERCLLPDQSYNRTLHRNVLDVDSRAQPLYTAFEIPDAVKAVSMNEILKEDLREECRADREASYLLLSSPGAITLFHTDMTGSCVCYILLHGCKTFYLIRPTPTNTAIFNAYLKDGRRTLFIGMHPDLDSSGCQKIVLREREAVFMPVGMIHAVETTGLSVALG